MIHVSVHVMDFLINWTILLYHSTGNLGSDGTNNNKSYSCLLLKLDKYLAMFTRYYNKLNHISDFMVSVLASSAVDRGYEPRSGQTKDY